MLKKLLFTLAIATLPLSIQAETLRLLNWEAFLSDEVKKQWEDESQNQLEIIHFDSDEKRDSILLNSKHHNIDIAVVDEVIAQRFGGEGRLIKIDEDKLPNLKNIGSFWRDRCSNYAVPYLWGTLGIIYRSDKVTTAPNSWKDIMEPTDELKGHIGMLHDYTDMLAPALFLDGQDFNTEDPTVLKQAFQRLKAQAPDVLTYEYPITFLQSSPKKDELYMAVAYGGDQYAMNELAGQEGLWKYVVPREGSILWVDCLAITSNSEHQDIALSFLNFLNRPQQAAQNAEELYVATPNEAALALLSEEFKTDSEIFPNVEIMKKSGLYKILSNENIQLRLRITNAVTNIYESQQSR